MRSDFGETPDGDAAELFTLRSDGLTVEVADHGATLVSVVVPDREGRAADVVLGFDSVAGYTSSANAYLGATVGRVANRTAHAEFTLAGRRYELIANEPPHHLHGGGSRAFHAVRWSVSRQTEDTVELTHVSPDGDEGYPGHLEVTATYRVRPSELTIEYGAVSDRPTPVNLTNHTYWNLRGAGEGTVLDHQLQVHADSFTPTDDEQIPTGAIEEVAGGPLDLREPRRLGERLHDLTSTPAQGYDHNYILRGSAGSLRPAARLTDPVSGRALELLTDQPALQVYSGNKLDPPIVGKGGRTYPRHGGLCLEPQHHPDAMHHDHFPSIVLQAGMPYRHLTVVRFSAG